MFSGCVVQAKRFNWSFLLVPASLIIEPIQWLFIVFGGLSFCDYVLIVFEILVSGEFVSYSHL